MITQQQFESLAQSTNAYSVSIYQPTYRVGNAQEDQIRYKNALSKAENKLQQRYGLSEQEATAFLSKAAALQEDLGFWQNQSDGLAVFVGPDRFEYYSCPVDFDPVVYVSPEYYLRPILPLLGETDRFHLLALSRGAVQLYTATRYSISEVDTKGLVPVNMEAALMLDEPSNDLSRAGGAEGGRGSNSPVYFGRGGDPSIDNDDLKAYLDRVDSGIADYLCDDRAPLLLGGSEDLVPIYRQANQYAHLYEDRHVAGNLENDSPGMLHEKAWAVIGDHFDAQTKRDHELYGDNKAANEAGSRIEEVVPACVNGRVAALWTDRNEYVYGRYMLDTNGVDIMTDEDKNATELLNLAAVSAFQSGARFYNVPSEEMPDGSSGICAIFRYTADEETTD